MNIYEEHKCNYLYNIYKRSLNKNIKKIKKLKKIIERYAKQRIESCRYLDCKQCMKRWNRAITAVQNRFVPSMPKDNYEKVGIIKMNEKRCIMRRRSTWALSEIKWLKQVLLLINKKIFEPIYHENGTVKICTMCWDPTIKHHIPKDTHIYP